MSLYYVCARAFYFYNYDCSFRSTLPDFYDGLVAFQQKNCQRDPSSVLTHVIHVFIGLPSFPLIFIGFFPFIPPFFPLFGDVLPLHFFSFPP